MTDLVSLVNRLRSQGFSYVQIKDKVVKMGNTTEEADSAISEYVQGILG